MVFLRWFVWIFVLLAVGAAGVAASPQWGFLPHRYCLMGNWSLIWAYVASHTIIELVYFTIPLILVTFARRRPEVFFDPGLAYWFAFFIVTCGLTHQMDIVTVWLPAYYIQTGVLVVCAVASVGTLLSLLRARAALQGFLDRIDDGRVGTS